MEGRIHREGLVALLATQADFRVLGATATCAETISLCATHRPQVLIVGAVPAWPRELSPIAAIRLASPATHVLALAPHGSDRCAHLNPAVPATFGNAGQPWMTHSTCLQEASSMGALAALDGDTDPQVLFQAVRVVARGERWGPARAGQANGHTNGHSNGNGVGHSLSPRELKVARLVGQGASNKEIAALLAISDLTVKKHVGNVLQKLGLHDRLQLGVCVARNPLAFGGHGHHD